ncbi:MAG TPA: hypothetical protein VGG73_12080 [Vicinamibacterales bacterium]
MTARLRLPPTPTLLAAALAGTVVWAALHWGALVAGGSDSYGYVSEAALLRRGELTVNQEDVVRSSPWPLANHTWAPLGYRPSPWVSTTIVPVYAPGLPMLMALFEIPFGFCGAFLVVPFCGGLAIWCTYILGRRMFGSSSIALAGAVLVATSPVFLYQLMNAMSDVPVTAAWTLALTLAVAGWPVASGLATAVTLAIRPNLLLLPVVIAAWFLIREWQRDRSAAIRATLRFSLGVLPSILGIAWLYSHLYESAWTSGYGSLADLYSFGFFMTNVRQFAQWLVEVELPVLVIALLAVVVRRAFPAVLIPFARILFGGTIAAVLLSYVFYQPFDVWWYLRFLLPMWPVMMLLAAAAIEGMARRWLPSQHAIVAGVVVAILSLQGVATAARRGTFGLGVGERRYIDIARFIAGYTEPEAVIVAVQHSGSLRLYAGRLTLKFDVLDPDWLDRTVDYLQSIGRRPYFVLDGAEVEAFTKRFGKTSRFGALAWPPMATRGSIAVYDPIDQRPGSTPIAIASTTIPRGEWCDLPQIAPPVLRMK